METAALIWFFALLFGSGLTIGYVEGQKLQGDKSPQQAPTVVDAGSSEVWKGTESSSVRVYWDPKS